MMETSHWMILPFHHFPPVQEVSKSRTVVTIQQILVEDGVARKGKEIMAVFLPSSAIRTSTHQSLHAHAEKCHHVTTLMSREKLLGDILWTPLIDENIKIQRKTLFSSWDPSWLIWNISIMLELWITRAFGIAIEQTTPTLKLHRKNRKTDH